MRISDWSSDVCSSDLERRRGRVKGLAGEMQHHRRILAHRIEHHRPLGLGDHLAHDVDALRLELLEMGEAAAKFRLGVHQAATLSIGMMGDPIAVRWRATRPMRSEEHTSELQSLMRISYAVFCLNNNRNKSYQRMH